MSDLDARIRRIYDTAAPIGPADVARVRRAHRRRLTATVGAAAALLVAAVAVAVNVVGGGASGVQVTGPGPASQAPVSTSTTRGGITVRFTLLTRRVAPGGKVSAEITITTAEAISGCPNGWRALSFTSPATGQQAPASDLPGCGPSEHAVPAGTSRYRVTQPAIYPSCGQDPNQASATHPVCTSGRGMPALPPGHYQVQPAFALQSLPVPPPIDLTITATASASSPQNGSSTVLDACTLLSARKIDTATGWSVTAGKHLQPEPTAPASKRTSLCSYGDRSHGLVEISTTTDGRSHWNPNSPGGGPGTRSRLRIAGRQAVAWTATHVQVVDFLVRGDYITVTVYDQAGHPRPGAAIAIARDLAPHVP